MDNIYAFMLEFLKKRSIVAEEKEHGTLTFSVNNLNFIFHSFESDPFFFRLSLPQINQKENAFNLLSKEIQKLNVSFKVAKIVEMENHTLWVIADQFVFSTNKIDLLFDRLIDAMSDMIKNFHQLEIQRSHEG